uniref:Uncharacterized protein n=1 Tax=Grammatophora oceanica TaxID=210454 RepID=A0A7S1YMP6_9STRA|eukprot:CAMPEP_0194047218 /NCGR_PEP_ID=MMETSP0009_2-20130614/23631_1 /TAXON_ID=210454 /ORGANISM="Grammatophora oceanica, Strain CCMP 410" /LENGTH=264 /DNA_ID=CAMNT_0038692761 /DNA_START=35 /DNA_END=829 /DNA_ORIENTATION=+
MTSRFPTYILLLCIAMSGWSAMASNASVSHEHEQEQEDSDPMAVMERVLAAGSQGDDCPIGSSLNADFIHIDVDISATESPRQLLCLDQDFKKMNKIIHDEIKSQGKSGAIKTKTGAVVFDAELCPSSKSQPQIYDIFDRRKLRGAAAQDEEEAEGRRVLQYGWPYNTGAGGGCYSCAKENCDDDTSRGRTSGCRRRRELFSMVVTADDVQNFWPVKKAIQNALRKSLKQDIWKGVECFSTLKKTDLTVVVKVEPVSVRDFCSS